MILSGTLAPDTGAFEALLDAGQGPVIALDPCGVLWETFEYSSRWSRLWQAWRLTPGQAQDGDVWDILGAIRQVSAAAGTAALAEGMFPDGVYTDLTRQLMSCVLAFAADTGYFGGHTGHTSGFAALAGQVWADDIWISLARWGKTYPHHPALQSARMLLTREGASESARDIRRVMATYHHPHVAATFTAGKGLNLSTLKVRPGQIIFLTPDFRCMESPELADVYRFLATALHAIGSLHCVNFTLTEPTMTAEGAPL